MVQVCTVTHHHAYTISHIICIYAIIIFMSTHQVIANDMSRHVMLHHIPGLMVYIGWLLS